MRKVKVKQKIKSKIKKGDDVILICGKDKGKHGKVLKVLPERFLVEGLNLVKKHTRPNPQTNHPGGIISMEASIHRSNVALWNPITQKADKVAIRTLESGERVRVFKSNNELVDTKV